MIALPGDEAHLWLVDCREAGADMPRWSDLVSQSERDRALAFKHDLREEFVRHRAAVRSILSAYLGKPAAAIDIKTDDNGKPMLANDDPVTFNLSHSGHWLLLGIARGRRIGVDVQVERESMRCLDLARRFFAGDEAAALEKLEPRAQRRLFFALWTLKEAHLKATGQGISGGLNRCTLLPDADRHPPLIRLKDADGCDWELRQLHIEDGYAAALAVEGTGARVRCARWTLGPHPPLATSLRDNFG